jgi:8-oxo-dGTP diphosphatase
MSATLPRIRVVAGAILRGRRLLAAQRPAGTSSLIAGKWEMPGGKVDPGETDQQALARELREELAIDVSVGVCIGEAEVVQSNRIIHLITYLCEITHGEPQALEHAELRWLGVGQLESVDWAGGDRQFVPAVRRALSQRTGGASTIDESTPVPPA